MRAPVDRIQAPPFPPRLPWINDAAVGMDQKQAGRAVLIEFWDFCRVNSIRTLPYLRAWHERYASGGLRVIGVHSAGFPPSADPDAVRAAVERLGIPYPVVVDVEHEIWGLYDNLGWPARYLWNERACLFEYHYGEGAYADTEVAIQELLGIEREPVASLRPEDAPGAELEAQSEDVPGPYSGPYEAGGVWAVLDGSGTVTANGRAFEIEHPGCYPLIEHPRHSAGVLELTVGDAVTCYATCFTPGVA
ncbi:MAG: DipZ protein [Actinomycetota bacterium]|nr:DipZ protein [Actinomycetota bacterium]